MDNNGTTPLSPDVLEYMNMWTNCGNASASYSEDIGSDELISHFKGRVAAYSRISLDDYDIIINSGASESNNFILKATINGYTRKIKRVPHIIVTSIEHKSLLECARRENDEGFHFTFIEPETSGSININHIKAAILPHTALVCCMHANNETGALNAVEELRPIFSQSNSTNCHFMLIIRSHFRQTSAKRAS